MEIKPFDVVAILEDQRGKGRVRGQVGTVVETLAPGVFEVEFGDNDGRIRQSGSETRATPSLAPRAR
jgi:hypothetical protein